MLIKKIRITALLIIAAYGLHAADITVEGEDFATGKGFNDGSVTTGTEITYSGGKYVEIINDDGEAAVAFTISTAGTYTVKLYYQGFTDGGDGSNVYYNLYDSNGYGSTPLQDGKIDDITSYGSWVFNDDFAAGNYYIALYGNPGTIFDKAEIIQGGSVLQTLEAESYEAGKGYQDENMSVVDAIPVYSGGKYAIVTGSEGEAAVPFTITTPGDYTIELFYHGTNVFYNLYGENGHDTSAANNGKLIYDASNDQLTKITDYSTLNSESFSYTFTTAGTYHIALYGETGTVFDKAEITLDQALSTIKSEAITSIVTCSNGAIVINAADAKFDYALYNSLGNLFVQGKSGGSVATIDAKNFPKGVYIVKVTSNGEDVIKKISVY